MKRIIVVVAALLALGWFLKTRYDASIASTSPPMSSLPEPPKPQERVSRLAPRVMPGIVNAAPLAPAADAPKPENATASYPQMSLSDVLQPNNVFHDAVFGVSATYPEGWTVRQAVRWGQNNRENTVFFSPPDGSAAVPSMYYQMYPQGAPAAGESEAMLREQARLKEESRSQNGTNEYKNDPDSFVFRSIDGHPSLSYFATYTRGDQVHAEYFTRILGEKGYVMFFVRGPANDVKALIPSVFQMGGTVKPP